MQFGKLLGQMRNPGFLLPAIFSIAFLYTLLYLLALTPTSHVHGGMQEKSLSAQVGLMLSGAQSANVNAGRKVVKDGEGVWVPGRHIHVMSAIFDIHSSPGRVMLQAFLKHSVIRDFVCCFSQVVDSQDYQQVPAVLENIDLRFIVDYQAASFSCLLPKDQVKYNVMTFAPDSCSANTTLPMRVVYPVRRKWEFAVCTKVSYGRLEPALLLEWFEFLLEVGVSRVQGFHNSLHYESMTVFKHYIKQGVMEVIEYHPRSKEVVFTESSGQSRQAQQDKTLIVQDCQYRLAGYDAVLTIDFDELPVPRTPYGSLNWVLQDMIATHPNASAFYMDPILMPPSWQAKSNDLNFWGFKKGAYIGSHCRKMAYLPSRTKVASTHDIQSKQGFQIAPLPQDKVHFLHFRECKDRWEDVHCDSLKPSILEETSLSRFSSRVKRRLQLLPLQNLVRDVAYRDKVMNFRIKDKL